ncbi:MAG: hypothetical protein MJ218_02580 [Opitutales bacterium]|nr:hypothetical protein [Opitutales bacterium]
MDVSERCYDWGNGHWLKAFDLYQRTISGCINSTQKDSSKRVLKILTDLFNLNRLQSAPDEKNPDFFKKLIKNVYDENYYNFCRVIIGAVNFKLWNKYHFRLEYHFSDDGVKITDLIEFPILNISLPIWCNQVVGSRIIEILDLLEHDKYDAVLLYCKLSLTRFLKVLCEIVFNKVFKKNKNSWGDIIDYLQNLLKHQNLDKSLNSLYLDEVEKQGIGLAIGALCTLQQCIDPIKEDPYANIFTGVKELRNIASTAHDVNACVKKYQARYVVELTCSTINFLTNAFKLNLLLNSSFSEDKLQNPEQSSDNDEDVPF